LNCEHGFSARLSDWHQLGPWPQIWVRQPKQSGSFELLLIKNHLAFEKPWRKQRWQWRSRPLARKKVCNLSYNLDEPGANSAS